MAKQMITQHRNHKKILPIEPSNINLISKVSIEQFLRSW